MCRSRRVALLVMSGKRERVTNGLDMTPSLNKARMIDWRAWPVDWKLPGSSVASRYQGVFGNRSSPGSSCTPSAFSAIEIIR